MARTRKTTNRDSWKFVDKREEFQGSSLRGETYVEGKTPSAAGSWLNAYEMEMYEKNRPRITYVVWSFYTPIAYFVEGASAEWYKVGQTFSSYTSRHRNGAMRNMPGHMVSLVERRGDTTVSCFDCGTVRHFTHVRDARTTYILHRG